MSLRAGSYSFSVLINHAPWALEREDTLETLALAFAGISWVTSFTAHRRDYRDGGPNPKAKPVDFTLAQWRWAAEQNATHHVFMTDDLELAPDFPHILAAMVQAAPGRILGLLSNHPKVPELARLDLRWYRTNSWVVGPCYVVPHEFMIPLLAWAEKRGPAGSVDKLGWADDSELNEWITREGPGAAYHPIPTPIEHVRAPSTWTHTGYGDEYSHERLNWKQWRAMMMGSKGEGHGDPVVLTAPAFWKGIEEAPMLRLP